VSVGILPLLQRPGARVHLLGVGGSGMSGLARLLLARGVAVSGSDLKPGRAVSELAELGMRALPSGVAGNVEGVSLLVYSSAVPEADAERSAARAGGVPQVRRASLLAALLSERRGVVVAGAHGKTTTSSMLTLALRGAGLAPSYYIGADVPALGASAGAGAGDLFVAEGDESDGSLVEYAPHASLVLNIEREHLDHYRSLDEIVAVFRALVERTTGPVVYCHDDEHARALCAGHARATGYGLHEGAMVRAVNVELGADGAEFEVLRGDSWVGRVRLGVRGLHNVANATGALTMAMALGAEFGGAAEALASFRGASRRFDVKFEAPGFLVVDDYAHHPTEVRATIAAARVASAKLGPDARVVGVFQPHRYSRTRELRDEFATAFTGLDRLFLTRIYAASEAPIPGVSGDMLRAAVEAAGGVPVVYEPDAARLERVVSREVREGDLLLVMGAGDVHEVAAGVARRLAWQAELRALLSPASRLVRNEPLRRHTTMRVGGPAEVWCEPADDAEVACVARFCRARGIPLTMFGRGSNLLVRDGGVSGVCMHLTGAHFTRVSVNGTRIEAGAGARLNAIVAAARRAGLSGLEFMEGIPATLGGALRMNAGAMGGSMFDRVISVRCVTPDGELVEVPAGAMGARYREVPGLHERIAVSAVLEGEPAAADEIAARLREFSGKRWSTQPAAPSAGCVFKNPEQCPAGRLVDELGLKETRSGGAQVSREHGNFIINTGGATAGDVLELMTRIREAARRERGVELEPEVQIVGEE
jgi:UDP-N-acetylmuramate--L-alanine ligase/UDP-N-acetylenolpyruvoylglucosamine reductase